MAGTAGGGRAGLGDGLMLCRVAGVPVLLSPSWWLGAAVIVLLYTPLVGRLLPAAGIWASALIAAIFAVLLAVSVLLHELGHCLTALRLGLPVHRVRLFLLGGISEMAHPAPNAADEGRIAVAGPAVSLSLAAVTGFGLLVINPSGSNNSMGIVWLLVAQTCVANLAVGVFNLLPALPLDGGRLLRALSWSLTGRRHIGTTAGVAGAVVVSVGLVLWAVAGLVRDVQGQWLRLAICLLMAWFAVMGAASEHAAEQRKRWPPDLHMRQLMHPVLQLPAESPVRDAWAAAAGRGVVLVRADGVAAGLLEQQGARRLAEQAPYAPAERAAQPVTAETILADTDSTETLLERVQDVPAWQFLVVDAHGRPTGVLHREEVLAALDVADRE